MISTKRKLPCGFTYELWEEFDRNTNDRYLKCQLSSPEDNSLFYHCTRNTSNKSYGSLIMYTIKPDFSIRQLPKDEFIAKYFGGLELDANQFLDMVKGYINYYKSQHRSSHEAIFLPNSKLPCILFGIGLGIDKATEIINFKLGRRASFQKIKSGTTTTYEVSDIEYGGKTEVEWEIGQHSVCARINGDYSIWFELGEYEYDTVKIEDLPTHKFKFGFLKKPSFNIRPKEKKSEIIDFVEKYRSDIITLGKKKKEYLDKLQVCFDKLTKDGTIPTNFKACNKEEQQIIREIDRLQDAIDTELELSKTNFYKTYTCLNKYFIEERRLNYFNNHFDLDKEPYKSLMIILGLKKPEAKKIVRTKQQTAKLLSDKQKAAKKKVKDFIYNNVYTNFSALFNSQNYAERKYGITDLSKVSSTQLQVIKDDLKKDLNEFIDDAATSAQSGISEELIKREDVITLVKECINIYRGTSKKKWEDV